MCYYLIQESEKSKLEDSLIITEILRSIYENDSLKSDMAAVE